MVKRVLQVVVGYIVTAVVVMVGGRVVTKPVAT